MMIEDCIYNPQNLQENSKYKIHCYGTPNTCNVSLDITRAAKRFSGIGTENVF
jgi:hypothetical protein